MANNDDQHQRRSPGNRRQPEDIRHSFQAEPKLHRSKRSLRRLIILFRTRPRLFARALLLLVASSALFLHWGVGSTESGRLRRRQGGIRGSVPRLFSFHPIGSFSLPSESRRGWKGHRQSKFHRTVKPMTELLTMSERRKKSKWYEKKRRYPIGDSKGRENCRAQYKWQETSFPSCNNVHEVDMTTLRHKFEDGSSVRVIDLINNGGWSDIWMMKEYNGTKRVLKTKLYKHDFTDRNFDRYRRDALVMERLTSYQNAMNIYGFCGVSHLVEYSKGGDIADADISDDPKEAQIDRLRIAQQVAASIASLHNLDREGRASVSSTDITPYQFLLIDGKYKLNDFNRARFIAWDQDKDEPCPFYVAKNPGKWRAPEEYHYEGESEKIDVYSMGNIIYFILTGSKPFDSISTDQTYSAVKKGERPRVSSKLTQSKDQVTIALLKAMDMCFEYDPGKRATAREVANYLTSQLEILEGNTSYHESSD